MSRTRSGYKDVEIITDPDGVVGVISERLGNNTFAVALFKEFERDGTTERTSFLQERHIDGAMRVLAIAREKMAILNDRRRAAARTEGRDL